MRNIHWIQVLIAFFLGATIGQRFVHMHPAGSVRNANGYA